MIKYTIDVLQYLQGTDAKTYPVFLRDGELDISQLNAKEATILNNALKSYDPLPYLKTDACSRIDAKAEALCTTLITPGITQQTRYARKLAQAEAFLQDGTPTEVEYPLIYNEVGITARSAGAVATAIVQASAAYDTFCDKVELVRAKAKGAVHTASNASLVASAEAAVVWPTAASE